MIMDTLLRKDLSTFKVIITDEETIGLGPTQTSKRGLAPRNPISWGLLTAPLWAVMGLAFSPTALMAVETI